jgi:membrane-bound serine protease (ClpP class)
MTMKRLWRTTFVLLVLVALLALALTAVQAQEGGHVNIASLKGTVDPIMAQYIARVIDASVNDGAVAVVIEMDTPGGLDSAMRKIITKMLASPVPIIVYVTPSGARAGSAGVFITVAANVAAMSPSTNIGSAHPVGGQGEDIEGNLGEKITNDAAAYIRTIAEKRGRNAEWAEEAVRKSVNITEKEAVDKKVVDFLANDTRDLLNKLDGKQVTTTTGVTTLKTAGIAIKRLDMNIFEGLLHTLVDPTIAYLLLTIGIWALIAEFNNPGALLPGVTGAICLILAFIAFESLPLNWGGVLLILVSVVLFIADSQTPSHGVLTAGGIIAFVIGSAILFSPLTPSVPSMPAAISIPWPWIILMTGLSTLVFTVAVGAGLRAQKNLVTVGADVIIGAAGIARSDLDPSGVVLVNAEEWTAVALDGHIAKGETVQVTSRDGLVLHVRAVAPPA